MCHLLLGQNLMCLTDHIITLVSVTHMLRGWLCGIRHVISSKSQVRNRIEAVLLFLRLMSVIGGARAFCVLQRLMKTRTCERHILEQGQTALGPLDSESARAWKRVQKKFHPNQLSMSMYRGRVSQTFWIQETPHREKKKKYRHKNKVIFWKGEKKIGTIRHCENSPQMTNKYQYKIQRRLHKLFSSLLAKGANLSFETWAHSVS